MELTLNNKLVSEDSNTMKRDNLKANCEKCFGFCCVALYFSTTEGFPVNKAAGKPCPNLQPDFRCSVHNDLKKLGYKGCMAFDCFGAGHKVAQVTYAGKDWRQNPKVAKQMYEVFLIARQINEMLWYLAEAVALKPAENIKNEIEAMIKKTESITLASPETLLQFDLTVHRAAVNNLLVKASELVRGTYHVTQKRAAKGNRVIGPGADLIGAKLANMDLTGQNLRGACLIAADLSGADLTGVDLIGADLRDANIRGANLENSIYLTQAQINTAKGDAETRIPFVLSRPLQWQA